MGCAASVPQEGDETAPNTAESPGAGNANADQPTSAVGPHDGTATSRVIKVQGAPPTVRMSKAQELALKKRQEEEREAEKKRNAPQRRAAAKARAGAGGGGAQTETLPTPKKSTAPSEASPSAAEKQSSNTTNTNPLLVPSPASSGALASSPSLTASPSSGAMSFSESDFVGFTRMKMLGKGSFGTTYECGLRSCKIVCVKVIEFGLSASAEDMHQLRTEIALMKRFNHPNIVQYYGCTEDPTSKNIHIFMEYVTGGSLTSYVKKFDHSGNGGRLPPETAKNWTTQMLGGVNYLHESGVIHRDIKGENILVTNDGILKLADFGCSKSIDEACSRTRGCSTMVGTPYWMAPEVLKSEPYGTKADIWSVGCTVVEMVTGKPPWPAMDNMWAAVYKIANSKGLPPGIPKDLPKDMLGFLEKCFERDPAKRPSAAELLKHKWLQ